VKELFRVFIIGLMFVVLTACGGGSDLGNTNGTKNSYNNESNTAGTQNSSDSKIHTATAELGNLAGAMVKIYKIEDNGTRTLLWQERTSDGYELNEIGKFNSHIEDLDDDTLYLYTVKGGEDWDSDDDGIKDAISTKNLGVIRAIAKGKDFKQADENFRITAVSELLYETVHTKLANNFNKNSYYKALNDEASKFLNRVFYDTDKVTLYNILTFNPVSKNNHLNIDIYNRVVKDILQGRLLLRDGYSSVLKMPNIVQNGNAITFSKDGKKAFIANSIKGLVIADIKDPLKPMKIAEVDTADEATKIAISKDESRALVADTAEGLVVVDIKDPANPVRLGRFDIPSGRLQKMALSNDGKIAFLLIYDYYGGNNNGLVVMDIEDPSVPIQIGLYKTINIPTDFSISKDGKKAFITDAEEGLIILDIDDLSNPIKIGGVDDFYQASGIAISKDETKAYIVDTKNLVTVNIKDKTNPTIMGKIFTDVTAQNVALSKDGTKAYVALMGRGLLVTDISNPKSIRLIGNYYTGDVVEDVTISSNGKQAYALGYNGLRAIDISLVGED